MKLCSPWWCGQWSRRSPVCPLCQGFLLSPRVPPAGTCFSQFCAQMGAHPSVCIQTRTRALPNTNIYLRFTVLENLVNNVNDASPRLAEDIVRWPHWDAASHAHLVIHTPHELWIPGFISHTTHECLIKIVSNIIFCQNVHLKFSPKCSLVITHWLHKAPRRGEIMPLGGVSAVSVCSVLFFPPWVFLLKGRGRLVGFGAAVLSFSRTSSLRSSYRNLADAQSLICSSDIFNLSAGSLATWC